MTLRRALIALTVTVVVAASLSFVRSTLALQATLERCGANDPANRVKSAFEVGRTRDIRVYIPGLLENPELVERSDQPAAIVVFDGAVRLRVVGNPRGGDGVVMTQRPYDNVVCVVIGDFDVVYVDVDLRGLRTP